MNRRSDSPSYIGIVGDVEESPWVSISPGRWVREPDREDGDGIEKLEREGDGKLSAPLNGSLADGLPVSSAAALVRWRLWSLFRQ